MAPLMPMLMLTLVLVKVRRRPGHLAPSLMAFPPKR